MKESELKALVSLLDDHDTEVMSHVEDKIISLGSEIIPFLEAEWENSLNPDIQRKIESLIHSLQFDHLKNRMKAWVESGGEDLLEGVWLIATYQYPDIDKATLKKNMEQLFHEIWLDFKDDLSPTDQVKLLSNLFFAKHKFGANTKNFHSPSNSMLNVVLETRKGNPITLCIIYMFIAQRLGMPVYGVNLPNLFILTYKTEDTQFYINAFNRGMIFSKEDIDHYISHLHLFPDPKYYEPCDNIEIVKRMLRNLVMAFEKISEHEKVDEIKQVLALFSADGLSAE